MNCSSMINRITARVRICVLNGNKTLEEVTLKKINLNLFKFKNIAFFKKRILSKMREVISVHVGQAGVQMGEFGKVNFWKNLMNEIF